MSHELVRCAKMPAAKETPGSQRPPRAPDPPNNGLFDLTYGYRPPPRFRCPYFEAPFPDILQRLRDDLFPRQESPAPRTTSEESVPTEVVAPAQESSPVAPPPPANRRRKVPPSTAHRRKKRNWNVWLEVAKRKYNKTLKIIQTNLETRYDFSKVSNERRTAMLQEVLLQIVDASVESRHLKRLQKLINNLKLKKIPLYNRLQKDFWKRVFKMLSIPSTYETLSLAGAWDEILLRDTEYIDLSNAVPARSRPSLDSLSTEVSFPAERPDADAPASGPKSSTNAGRIGFPSHLKIPPWLDDVWIDEQWFIQCGLLNTHQERLSLLQQQLATSGQPFSLAAFLLESLADETITLPPLSQHVLHESMWPLAPGNQPQSNTFLPPVTEPVLDTATELLANATPNPPSNDQDVQTLTPTPEMPESNEPQESIEMSSPPSKTVESAKVLVEIAAPAAENNARDSVPSSPIKIIDCKGSRGGNDDILKGAASFEGPVMSVVNIINPSDETNDSGRAGVLFGYPDQKEDGPIPLNSHISTIILDESRVHLANLSHLSSSSDSSGPLDESSSIETDSNDTAASELASSENADLSIANAETQPLIDTPAQNAIQTEPPTLCFEGAALSSEESSESYISDILQNIPSFLDPTPELNVNNFDNTIDGLENMPTFLGPDLDAEDENEYNLANILSSLLLDISELPGINRWQNLPESRPAIAPATLRNNSPNITTRLRGVPQYRIRGAGGFNRQTYGRPAMQNQGQNYGHPRQGIGDFRRPAMGARELNAQNNQQRQDNMLINMPVYIQEPGTDLQDMRGSSETTPTPQNDNGANPSVAGNTPRANQFQFRSNSNAADPPLNAASNGTPRARPQPSQGANSARPPARMPTFSHPNYDIRDNQFPRTPFLLNQRQSSENNQAPPPQLNQPRPPQPNWGNGSGDANPSFRFINGRLFPTGPQGSAHQPSCNADGGNYRFPFQNYRPDFHQMNYVPQPFYTPPVQFMQPSYFGPQNMRPNLFGPHGPMAPQMPFYGQGFGNPFSQLAYYETPLPEPTPAEITQEMREITDVLYPPNMRDQILDLQNEAENGVDSERAASADLINIDGARVTIPVHLIANLEKIRKTLRNAARAQVLRRYHNSRLSSLGRWGDGRFMGIANPYQNSYTGRLNGFGPQNFFNHGVNFNYSGAMPEGSNLNGALQVNQLNSSGLGPLNRFMVRPNQFNQPSLPRQNLESNQFSQANQPNRSSQNSRSDQPNGPSAPNATNERAEPNPPNAPTGQPQSQSIYVRPRLAEPPRSELALVPHRPPIRGVRPLWPTHLPTIAAYGSLAPLEEADLWIRRRGLPTTTYATVSSVTNVQYVMKRLHNFNTRNTRYTEICEKWLNIRHQNLVKLTDFMVTSEFRDESCVLIYEYCEGVQNLLNKFFEKAAVDDAVYVNNLLLPSYMSRSAPDSDVMATVENRIADSTIPEADIWNVVVQLASVLKEVHDRGLACNNINLTNVLINNDQAVKIAFVGKWEVLNIDADPAETVEERQQNDFTNMGQVIMAMALRSLEVLQPSIQTLSLPLLDRVCSTQLKTLVLYLLKTETRSTADLLRHVGEHFLAHIDRMQSANDAIEHENQRETMHQFLYNILERLCLVMQHLNFSERSEDAEMAEKINTFRDHLFHTRNERGVPSVDLEHVFDCLVRMEAGVNQRLELRGGSIMYQHNTLTIFYNELKDIIDKVYQRMTERPM